MPAEKKLKYSLLSALLGFFSLMPLRLHRAFGALAGWVMSNVVRYRKDVALKNVRNAFPDRSEEQIRAILKKFYRYLGTIYCEAIWFGSCRKNPRRLAGSNICELSGQELLNGCFKQGRSVLVLLSHTGNFELFSGIMTYLKGEPLAVPENHLCASYKRLHNEFWNDFIYRNRLSGLQCPQEYDALVESSDILRYVYRHKDDRFAFHFITDQYPYVESHNVEVEFFNLKTISMTGGLAMAAKFSMPVVYMRFSCRPKGGYAMEYLPFCENAAKEDIKELTQKYYRMIEDDIRTQPWNYLWTHKRWKTLNY